MVHRAAVTLIGFTAIMIDGDTGTKATINAGGIGSRREAAQRASGQAVLEQEAVHHLAGNFGDGGRTGDVAFRAFEHGVQVLNLEGVVRETMKFGGHGRGERRPERSP